MCTNNEGSAIAVINRKGFAAGVKMAFNAIIVFYAIFSISSHSHAAEKSAAELPIPLYEIPQVSFPSSSSSASTNPIKASSIKQVDSSNQADLFPGKKEDKKRCTHAGFGVWVCSK